MADYISHLEEKLRDVDKAIRRMSEKLETGTTRDKVKALADLGQLRTRRDELAARIAEAREKGSENWSEFRTSLQEEADAIRDTLEGWLTRLD